MHLVSHYTFMARLVVSWLSMRSFRFGLGFSPRLFLFPFLVSAILLLHWVDGVWCVRVTLNSACFVVWQLLSSFCPLKCFNMMCIPMANPTRSLLPMEGSECVPSSYMKYYWYKCSHACEFPASKNDCCGTPHMFEMNGECYHPHASSSVVLDAHVIDFH